MHNTWQGNVREFQDIINRAVLLTTDLIIVPSGLSGERENQKEGTGIGGIELSFDDRSFQTKKPKIK